MSQFGATLTKLDHAGRESTRAGALFVALCSIQGLYFLATGVWPLVSIDTFQMATGPKTDHLVTGHEGDHWLVNTVAVPVTAIALVLLLAAWLNRPSPEVVFLAVGSALGLATIDLVYVTRDVLWPIYLADAAIELAFVAAWLWVAVETRAEQRTPTGSHA